MKINGIPVGTPIPRSDWNQTNPEKADFIKNKPVSDKTLTQEGRFADAKATGDAIAAVVLTATDDGDGVVTLSLGGGDIPEGGGGGIAVSPTIEVDEIEGGHKVTVTDVNGSQDFNVMDGKDGNDGVGIAEGWQETISTEDGGDNVFTFMYTDGINQQFYVKNGSKGSPGYTPRKGIDYYTEADKKEMVAAVLAALPTWQGGSY